MVLSLHLSFVIYHLSLAQDLGLNLSQAFLLRPHGEETSPWAVRFFSLKEEARRPKCLMFNVREFASSMNGQILARLDDENGISHQTQCELSNFNQESMGGDADPQWNDRLPNSDAEVLFTER